VRGFLLQYVGDVAVYISSHTVSKFAQVRDAIQACALEVGEAVFQQAGAKQPFDYPGVIVVGHSLGSVIAYDMLNALLVRDGLADQPLNVAGRTRMFLTFGSPLDKTAFIYRAQRQRPTGAREALAAAKQPMILDYRWRPARWVNIHSPSDWISGSLDYYDDRDQVDCRSQWVHDEKDPEATTPLAAHNEYWHGRLLADRLYEAVTA
jgi:pimeloyl-ACP methyl ester carboxylesterase